MLWDLIRDFFVIHVFGGVTSDGTFIGGMLGSITDIDANYYDAMTTAHLYFPIGETFIWDNDSYVSKTFMSIGDWLSTTATIISISIIVVLCCLFIKKIVSTISNLMSR